MAHQAGRFPRSVTEASSHWPTAIAQHSKALDIDPVIYGVDTDSSALVFVRPTQHIASYSASHIEAFSIEDRHYLAVANSQSTARSSFDVESFVYRYDVEAA